MRKELFVPIIGIIAGEIILTHSSKFDIFVSLGLYASNILSTILLITLCKLSLEEKNILQGLTLLLILRFLNLSIQFFEIQILQYLLIYGIMYIPIYFTIKNQRISFKELGINCSRLYFYIPLSIMIGVAIMIFESHILQYPIEKTFLSELIFFNKSVISNAIILSTIIIFVIGTTEEIIFRSIIQTRIEKNFGSRYGILMSGGIFGIMHVNYGDINNILLTTIIGLILAYFFYMMRNLPFIAMIHGTANIGIIVNKQFPFRAIYSVGEFFSFFLIMVISISFLLTETKYYNEYSDSTFNMVIIPLLLVFADIMFYKISH